jgi:hypothetical protein
MFRPTSVKSGLNAGGGMTMVLKLREPAARLSRTMNPPFALAEALSIRAILTRLSKLPVID